MTLTESYLVMCERYGAARLSTARADQFVREQSTHGALPDDWHELLAPDEHRLEERLAAQAVQTPLSLLQLLFGRSPAVDVAHARVARAGAA